MSENVNIIAIEIREIYQNQCDTIALTKESKVLLSHFGTFSQNLVSSLSENAEKLLSSKNIEKTVVKRVFSIMIEGLQNIRMHGEIDDTERQLGFVILSESKSFINISLANVIDPDDFYKVDKYIEKINNYTEQELRDTYISVLTNDFLSLKDGSGLGFITTRLKSGQPLKHSYFALEGGKMLFTFKIKLTK